MKIAYVTMQFPVPSETFASLDVNALCNTNKIINVFCLRPRHKEFNKLINERHKNNKNLNIYHLDFFNFITSLIYIISNPFKIIKILNWILKVNRRPNHILKSILLLPSIFYIYKLLDKNKPDVVHLFWGHYPSMLLFLLKEFMPNMPFTMFLGAHDLETKYQGSFEIAKYAKKVFTHSYKNVELLVSMGIKKNKIRVVHRGTLVNSSTISELQEKIFFKEEITFLTATRLIKQKGVDEVFDIFVKFIEKHPNSKLNIAGDGPHKEILQKKINKSIYKDNVFFLGHLSQDELFSHMCNTDFFILMSRYKNERLPNVIKEAMLRKCICITTYTIGIEELIKNKKNGYIFYTKQQVLQFLLNINFKDTSFKNIVRNGQRTIVEDFNVNKAMEKYTEEWVNISKGDNS